MKKLSLLKKIQLAVMLVLAITCGILLFADDRTNNILTSTGTAMVLYILVWISLILSFAFLFLDLHFLSTVKHEYSSMNEAAYSDHLSGIPNRFSCDILLDKYADQPAPLTLGCIMIDLDNLAQINRLYGHTQGNEQLKQFSQILSSSAVSLCFVGRNGGNKFLAVFEDSTEEKMLLFLDRVKQKVEEHNLTALSGSIQYKTGTAFNGCEKLEHLTELISLANSRIYS